MEGAKGTDPGPEDPPASTHVPPPPDHPAPSPAEKPAAAETESAPSHVLEAMPAPSPASGSPAQGETKAARRRRRKRERAHPYAHEASTPAEKALDPSKVAIAWIGLGAMLAVGGWYLAGLYSPHVTSSGRTDWEPWTLVALFGGIGLLGAGFLRGLGWRRVTLAGWILFAAYWGLTAQDLYYKEGADYVNMTFAILGVFFFTYLAYHDWLSLKRGVSNAALRFLSIATFVAAGSYFLIDKVQYLRLALINVVSEHTKWGLDLFGQGDKAGLVFVTDVEDTKSPTTFFYPDKYCSPNREDAVGQYCAGDPSTSADDLSVTSYGGGPDGADNLWESLLLYTPGSESLEIVPVSIILACTALQSIMLFVGLFAGTTATWKRKVMASVIVAAVVYILNLLRNVGIIWFYGQGHASFWVMHNAIGKGGSLIAMIAIAFAVFRWFPEFFQALVSVLDLPERDGPLERALRLGRRRPEPASSVATETAAA